MARRMYGVAAMAPVAIAPTALTLPTIASYARPPHDVRNAKAYAYWLAHGGRRRKHQASLSGPGAFGHGGGHGGHGGRRRWRGRGWYPGAYYPGYYDNGDPSTICVIDPRTGIQTCMPAQSASMLMPSMAMPSAGGYVDPYMASQGVTLHPAAVTPPKAGWASPGGFMVAQVGSSTRPTAGFHDYGYGDAFGALDPAQLLEANDSANETQSGKDFADTLKALSPALSTAIEQVTDPYKRVQILKVKIKNAKRSGASASRIQTLQAKLAAAQHRLDVKNESLDSTRDWRMLGKAGIVTGIGIGAAVIFFILMQSFKSRRVAVAT